MAFTAWELIRGALIALGVFLLIAPLGYAIASLVQELHPAPSQGMGGSSMSFGPLGDSIAIWFGSIVGMAMFSIPATIVLGLPLGWLLGWATARRRSWTLHTAAFAALGLVVGTATTAVALVGYHSGVALGAAGWLIPILATGFAAGYGWWRTMASAVLRDDWADRLPDPEA